MRVLIDTRIFLAKMYNKIVVWCLFNIYLPIAALTP